MRVTSALVLLLLWATAPTALAGPAADELSRCLVQSSTAEDKLKLVKWMFTSMALHPAVADLAPVTEAARDAANRDMAQLLASLLEARCLEPARNAIASEGAIALQTSFAIFHQVAANDLFSHPDVIAGLGALTEFLDSTDLERKLGIGDN